MHNRKDRADFQSFLSKLRSANDKHPDKNEEIIKAVDNVISWINSPQGYSTSSNDPGSVSMTDIYS